MKDGRTHLAYKAEHVVDLEARFVLAAEIRPADQADSQTLVDSVMEAKINLEAAGSDVEIEEVVADKGYHANATLELASRPWLADVHSRAEAAETIESGPTSRKNSGERWSTIAAAWPARKASSWVACGANAWSGASLMSATRAGRDAAWIRRLEEVTKRYRMAAAAHNLGRIMRLLFGIGKPRVLQAPADFVWLVQLAVIAYLAMVGDRSAPLERRRRLPVHAGTTLTAGPPKAFPKRTARRQGQPPSDHPRFRTLPAG